MGIACCLEQGQLMVQPGGIVHDIIYIGGGGIVGIVEQIRKSGIGLVIGRIDIDPFLADLHFIPGVIHAVHRSRDHH
ncbi:hypothetical protein D3C73_1046100 [compost metagenome]